MKRGGNHGFGAEGCAHSVRHLGVEPARRERAQQEKGAGVTGEGAGRAYLL